jgi:hypothetical protein
MLCFVLVLLIHNISAAGSAVAVARTIISDPSKSSMALVFTIRILHQLQTEGKSSESTIRKGEFYTLDPLYLTLLLPCSVVTGLDT